MEIKNIDNKVINEDRYLLEQIQLGNSKAIDKLFHKYYKSLCRFGSMYEANIHIVEENVDDVFVTLWNNRNKLNQIKNPKSYIYVILKNSLKKPNTKHDTWQTNQEEKIESINLYPSIEEQIIADEQKEINKNIISNILSGIPKRTRQVFEMSKIDGFKYKEISELLDITPKTVENHIGLALKYISKELASYK